MQNSEAQAHEEKIEIVMAVLTSIASDLLKETVDEMVANVCWERILFCRLLKSHSEPILADLTRDLVRYDLILFSYKWLRYFCG